MNPKSQSTNVDRPERLAPVARKGTLSPAESVPFYYKLIDFITLSSAAESVLQEPEKIVRSMLSFVESVGYSPSRRAVLGHLLLGKADSPSTIRVKTGLSEPSVYRAIDDLVELGYIVWATPTKINWKSKGYSSGIVALPNFTPEDLIEARNREVERVKPQARMISKVYQMLLNEYTGREPVTRRDVITRLKPRFSGFAAQDVVTWVDGALELAQRNKILKVWR